MNPQILADHLNMPGRLSSIMLIPQGLSSINTKIGDSVLFVGRVGNDEEVIRIEFVYPLLSPDELTISINNDVLKQHQLLLRGASRDQIYSLIENFLDELMD